jgi:hypothetical protein
VILPRRRLAASTTDRPEPATSTASGYLGLQRLFSCSTGEAARGVTPPETRGSPGSCHFRTPPLQGARASGRRGFREVRLQGGEASGRWGSPRPSRARLDGEAHRPWRLTCPVG